MMNKYILMICLILATFPGLAHEGHDHGPPLAVSVAFDSSGKLWRASAREGFVVVDSSDDLGRSFSLPIKLNSEPQKIDTDGDARPKLAINAAGHVYVTWTQALPKPYTGYIWFARSQDGGKHFAPAVIVHQDRAEITHRFDALAVAPSGRIYVAWVDKRDLVAAKAAKKPYEGAAIYYAISDDSGASFQPEQKLVDSSCECCRIALTTEASGEAVAMWRHLFAGGVRDHAIAKFGGYQKSELKRASFGGWKIDACPHHGPALAIGGTAENHWGWHMAWFDGGNKTGLYYARMDDQAWVSSPAKRFGDVTQQAGHPALLSRGERVWLVWKELTDQASMIKLAVSEDGGRSWGESQAVMQTAGASDYPQLLEYQDKTYLAWNTQKDGFRMIPIETAP